MNSTVTYEKELQARASLNQQLRPGEKMLWVGHPVGSLLSQGDFILIPFTLLWCGFAFMWEWIAVSNATASTAFFGVFGVPFVLIGLYVAFGRFVVKARTRSRTLYAVTNRRLLSQVNSTLRTLPLDQISEVGIAQGRGRGTISFGPRFPGGALNVNNGLDQWGLGRSGPAPLAFYDITDASRVARLIEDAASAAKQTPE